MSSSALSRNRLAGRASAAGGVSAATTAAAVSGVVGMPFSPLVVATASCALPSPGHSGSGSGDPFCALGWRPRTRCGDADTGACGASAAARASCGSVGACTASVAASVPCGAAAASTAQADEFAISSNSSLVQKQPVSDSSSRSCSTVEAGTPRARSAPCSWQSRSYSSSHSSGVPSKPTRHARLCISLLLRMPSPSQSQRRKTRCFSSSRAGEEPVADATAAAACSIRP
mmetsp:Transcript_107675/g.347545  ORF Transcript_107675/g.347545 Transcript_107675/m.347545 type:complete len:230 (-) Transcript_107675:78-767(-)